MLQDILSCPDTHVDFSIFTGTYTDKTQLLVQRFAVPMKKDPKDTFNDM